MIQDLLSHVVKGIDADRADLVKTAVTTVKDCEARDEGYDLKLDSLLNGLCCAEGTILHLAVTREAYDCVRTILDSGAKVSVLNKSGQRPVDLIKPPSKVMEVFNHELLQCVAKSDANRVRELLDGGVSVNFEDTAESGNTPLHWAASYGSPEVLKCLLDHGAMVDATNTDGSTALHDAAQRGNESIIRLLLEAKASIGIVAFQGKFKGKTPAILAATHGLQGLFLGPSLSVGHVASASPSPSLLLPPSPSQVSANGTAGLSNGTILNGSSLINGNLSGKTSVSNLPSPIKSNMSSTSSLSTGASNTVVMDTLTSPVTSAVTANLSNLSLTPAALPEEPQPSIAPGVQEKLDLLWPIPQQVVALDGPNFDPGDKIVVAAVNGPNPGLVHDILNVWRALRSSFDELNLTTILEPLPFSTSPGMAAFGLSAIICQVNHRIFKQAESYRITVKAEQVKIIASDLPGMHYAVSAFIQLLELFDETGTIPPLQINDWPDLRSRGVLLDLSLGRIPQEDVLWDLIDRLSILKINELHIYHRFTVNEKDDAYCVWQFPYPRNILMDLDRFCTQRHMSLVPVLDVGPKVTFNQVVMMFGAFTDFLSCFTKTEHINIGPRLSSFLLDVNEDGSMRAMHFLPSSLQTLQVCGSIFNPSCFKNSFAYLPSNMMLMEYGYVADFEFPNTKLYCSNGVPFYVCPGTSAWNSLAGCPGAAVQNIYNAAKRCHEDNGVGMLVCNWSGKGHVTHDCFSILPMVAAAGMSWNKSTTQCQALERIPAVTSYYMIVDQNQVIGRILLELGQVETTLLCRQFNRAENNFSGMLGESGSLLFQLLTFPDSVNLTHLTPADFQRGIRSIRKVQEELLHTDLDCLHAQEVLYEVTVTCDIMMAACRIGLALIAHGKNPGRIGEAVINIGVANLHPTTKTDLSNRLLGSVEPYRKAWLGRNHSQGLSNSLLVLFSAVRQILPQVGLDFLSGVEQSSTIQV